MGHLDLLRGGRETDEPYGLSAMLTNEAPVKTLGTRVSFLARNTSLLGRVNAVRDATERGHLDSALSIFLAGFNLYLLAVVNHKCEYNSFQ